MKAASAFFGAELDRLGRSLRLYRGQPHRWESSRSALLYPVWGAGCSQCLLRCPDSCLVGAQRARRGAHRRDQTRVGGELLCVRGAQNACLPQHSRVGRGICGALHGRETDAAYGHSWRESASDPPCHGFSAAPCMPLGPGQSAFRAHDLNELWVADITYVPPRLAGSTSTSPSSPTCALVKSWAGRSRPRCVLTWPWTH